MDQAKLSAYIKKINNFYDLSYTDQIVLFGYFIEHELGSGEFSSKDITSCFKLAALTLPANLSYMLKFLTTKKRSLVRYGKFYRIHGKEISKIQKILKGKSSFKQTLQKDFPKELGLHEKVVSVSRDLFFDGYYTQAIFEAVKVLEKEIKSKSKVKNMVGVKLVNHVFNSKNPILKIVQGDEQEEVDEREGFRLILLGVFLGIKNPKSHSIQELNDPSKALEYLSFLSLLLKRVDESN